MTCYYHPLSDVVKREEQKKGKGAVSGELFQE